MTNLKVKLTVLLSVIFISSSAILIKLSDATPLHNAFYRMLFSALLTSPIIWKQKQKLLELNVKQILFMGISGVFLGLHFYVWFTSLDYTSIASSTVLVCLSPIFTVIGSALFFKARFQRKEILLILLAIIGSFVITYKDLNFSGATFLGNSLALLGALLIALYLLIGQHIRQLVSASIYTFFVYAFAALTLGIMTLFHDVPLFQQTSRDWLIFILLALFPTLFGHSILSWALKYLSTPFISTSILFEPVITIIFAMILFNEIPSIYEVSGGVIIIIALFLYTFWQHPTKTLEATEL